MNPTMHEVANRTAVQKPVGRTTAPERVTPEWLTIPGHGHRPESRDLVKSTYTVVLAGGRGTRLKQLTGLDSKPAMPFAGHYRIIDFTLSNCINSGLRQISVLTQYRAQSLMRHLQRGWSFLDAGRKEMIDVVPAQQKLGESWYSGTADAVFQNLDLIRESDPDYVLVLAGDHVYQMDYGRLIAEHVERRADVTVACTEVPLAKAGDFGVVAVDPDRRIVAFQEKPKHPRAMPGRPDVVLASMGIYIFDASYLYRVLAIDAINPDSRHDFGGDVLPGALATDRVFAYEFAHGAAGSSHSRPYWRDVGTLDAYWEANMALLGADPELDLYDAGWPIRSAPLDLQPARFESDAAGGAAEVSESIVASGCVVKAARLRRSLLSAQVKVGAGSLIDHSILLPGVVVGKGAVVRRAIVDSRCVLPDGIKIGVFPAEDAHHYEVTEAGVVLVTAEMLNKTGCA